MQMGLDRNIKLDLSTICISELQQQAYAQRLELQYAQHGYIESRREQVRLQEELSMKEEVLRDTQIRSMHEMGKMKRAQELRVDEVPVQNSRENHETIQRVTPRSSSRNSPLRNKQGTRISSTSYRVGDSFSQEMTNKRHNSDADICKKAVDYVRE